MADHFIILTAKPDIRFISVCNDLTKKLFGSSSERRSDDIPGQQNLFDEAEMEQDPSLLEEETVIKEHTRKKKASVGDFYFTGDYAMVEVPQELLDLTGDEFIQAMTAWCKEKSRGFTLFNDIFAILTEKGWQTGITEKGKVKVFRRDNKKHPDLVNGYNFHVESAGHGACWLCARHFSTGPHPATTTKLKSESTGGNAFSISFMLCHLFSSLCFAYFRNGLACITRNCFWDL